jgi:AcrR family transcriptional regulator
MQAIVEAARRLVGGRGNDAVSVREIAAEAGVPISSVYQYFPDKNAILRVLIVDYLDRIQGMLAGVVDEVDGVDDLPAATDRMIDALVRLFRREPALGTIWSAVQANTVLREIDLDDTRKVAAFMAALFRKVAPGADRDLVFDACLWAAHMVPHTIRVAHHAPPRERERLIRETKSLMTLRVRSLV